MTSELPRTIIKGSRKRKRFREEEKAARKGFAFEEKQSEKSGFRRKDEVTGSIPVSSSKLDRVEPGEIGSSRSFFIVNQVQLGVADRRCHR